MTMTRPGSKPAKSGITFLCWCILAWGAAVMFGWLPNPADRFFEAGPQTYRNYADVLVASGSPRLRHGLKDALEKDGKLIAGFRAPKVPEDKNKYKNVKEIKEWQYHKLIDSIGDEE